MATVEKIRKDIEKTKEKISAQQKRLRELEAQLTEEENLEIVRMVKAVRMDNKSDRLPEGLRQRPYHPARRDDGGGGGAGPRRRGYERNGARRR